MPNSLRIPLTTKGDVLVHNGTRLARLPVGTNGKAIVADSSQPCGLTYAGVEAPFIEGALAVLKGGEILLTCSAPGTGQHFQWYRGATAVGTDAAILSITGAEDVNAGEYRCQVTSAAGEAFSNTLTIAVLDPPVITAEAPPAAAPTPNSVIACGVTATGDSLAYQWQKLVSAVWTTVANGGLTSGAQTNTLTLQATAPNEGSFRCVVINAVASATSTPMPFSVSPPVIVTQPQGIAADGTCAVVATGAGTLTYQWLYGGTAISGQTTDVLNLNASGVLDGLDLTLGRAFSCRVANPAGSVTSVGVFCRPFRHGSAVGVGVALRAQPDPVVLTANLTGPPGTTYSWTRNAVSVGGDADAFGDSVPVLTLRNLQLADAGTYVCTATNAHGSAAGDGLDVSVPVNNAWHTHPGNLFLFSDEAFSVAVDGKFHGVMVSGAPGWYQGDGAWVPSVDGLPVWASRQAFETWRGPTYYPEGTGDGTPDSWRNRTLSLNGATAAPLTSWLLLQTSQGVGEAVNLVVQPFVDGNLLPYSIVGLSVTVITKAAVTFVRSSPVILPLGDPLSLTVGATGENLLHAWYRDNVRLPAFATGTLERANASADDAGSYVAKVANVSHAGPHVAAASAVVVNVVGITATPASQALASGGTLTPAYCGTNVEFRRTLDGVAGAWQDSPTFAVGSAFGVWQIRIRSKADPSKLHDSGEFTVSQKFVWQYMSNANFAPDYTGVPRDEIVWLSAPFVETPGNVLTMGGVGYPVPAPAPGTGYTVTFIANRPAHPGTHSVNLSCAN